MFTHVNKHSSLGVHFLEHILLLLWLQLVMGPAQRNGAVTQWQATQTSPRRVFCSEWCVLSCTFCFCQQPMWHVPSTINISRPPCPGFKTQKTECWVMPAIGLLNPRVCFVLFSLSPKLELFILFVFNNYISVLFLLSCLKLTQS